MFFVFFPESELPESGSKYECWEHFKSLLSALMVNIVAHGDAILAFTLWSKSVCMNECLPLGYENLHFECLNIRGLSKL